MSVVLDVLTAIVLLLWSSLLMTGLLFGAMTVTPSWAWGMIPAGILAMLRGAFCVVWHIRALTDGDPR